VSLVKYYRLDHGYNKSLIETTLCLKADVVKGFFSVKLSDSRL